MPVPDRLRRDRRTERTVALVLVVLAGCGVTESAGSGQASTPTAPAPAATSTALVEPGATAPGATAPGATAPGATAPGATPTPVATTDGPLGFSHPQVGGGTIDFAALAGQPVALWFWAPT